MGSLVPYLLFALEKFDRHSQSVRTAGGVIIAMESPVYVGRLLAGAEQVEDKSALVIAGQMTSRLFAELQVIGRRPGAEVTREFDELFTFFDDEAMTRRGQTAVFIRHGSRTSFVRRTGRYDELLREFVTERMAREGRR